MSQPFRQSAASVSISASTTTANQPIAGHQGSVVAHNTTGVWAYFTTGKGSSTAATSAGYWLAPSTSQSISVPMDHDYAAALLSSGTGTIGVTPGVGL